MKLHSELTINGHTYRAGEEVSPWYIYPFFLIHMGMFGGSGFLMAYAFPDVDLWFLYLHGGIAILVYLVFYLAIFGREQVSWMLINGALGLFGIWVEIDLVLGFFGRALSDYPWQVHLTPFLYYILYTFLLRQMVLDFTGVRGDPVRQRRVEIAYVLVSLLIYGGLWLLR